MHGHGMAAHQPPKRRADKPHVVADIDFSEDTLVCTCGASMSSTVEAWAAHRLSFGQKLERAR